MSNRIPYCCVPNCSARLRPLHNFPIRQPPLFQEWKRRIQNPKFMLVSDKVIYKNYKVCDIHFNDFNRNPQHEIHSGRLIFCSVPTINITGFTGPITKENSFFHYFKQSAIKGANAGDANVASLPNASAAASTSVEDVEPIAIAPDPSHTSIEDVEPVAIAPDPFHTSIEDVEPITIEDVKLIAIVPDPSHTRIGDVEPIAISPDPSHTKEKAVDPQWCVVCTSPNQFLISVGGEEGERNDLYQKMNLYLPMEVNLQDVVCFPCATTLISFHNLIITCERAHGILTEVNDEDKENSLTENNSQLEPDKLCGMEAAYRYMENNEDKTPKEGLACVTENLNQHSLKESNAGETLEMEVYDECLERRPTKQKSSGKNVSRCSYNWSEINKRLNSLRSYTCHLCCVCLPNVGQFHEHFKYCSQSVCGRCLKALDSGEIMDNHLKSCKTYSCYMCPSKFKVKKKSRLTKHQIQKHPTSICDLCHEIFTDDLECEKHKMDRHEFICEQCNNSFESSMEAEQYRHTILPDNRLLCLSCYGIYQCLPKIQEANHVTDSPIIVSVSSSQTIETTNNVGEIKTNIDELMTLREDPTMLVGMDVTTNTSELECPALNYETFSSTVESQTANDLNPLSENNRTAVNDSNDHLYFKTEGSLCCDHCSKMFASHKYLQLHILRSHPNESSYICLVCAEKFQSKMELYIHQKTYCVLECGDCGEKVKGKTSMKHHVERHMNQTYICHDCGNEYAKKTSLIQHIRVSHSQELVCCSACGILINKYKYSGHYSRNHTQRPLLQCHVCLKNFTSRIKLMIHSQTHTLRRPFACSICPSIFKLKKYLNKHMKSCHPPTYNVCRFCTKVFQSVELFNEHFAEDHKNFSKFILLDNGEGYHCVHCQQIFDSSPAMFAHSKEMDKEYGNTKTRRRVKKYGQNGQVMLKYTCTYCVRDFSSKKSLLNHVQWIHSLERNFQCSYCPNRFKRKDAKMVHERIHTKEKPYSCSMCDSKFRQQTDMKRHEARHRSELASCHQNLPRKGDKKIKVTSKRVVESSWEESGDTVLLHWPIGDY